MSTFGQCHRGGHHHHHHSKHHLPDQILTSNNISTKTDRETTKYAFDDTPKIRKIKFMFRVRFSLLDYLIKFQLFRCMISIGMDVYQKKIFKKYLK
jgi:hypothetical protein